MELKDTVQMMDNADYKERFKAEYYQVKIRYEKLKTMCNKYDAGVAQGSDFKYLGFTPSCSLYVLKQQLDLMARYMNILEVRAVIENIDLSELSS